LVFVDVSEDSNMADDVVTPLNLSIALVEEEKLDETLFDMNTFRRLHDK
jgi:hypothetical protein